MTSHLTSRLRSLMLVVLAGSALLAFAAQPVSASVIISNLDAGNADFGFNATQIGQATLIGNRPISLTSVQMLQTGGFTTGETLAVYSRNTDGTLGTSLLTGFSYTFDTALSVTTATATGSFTLQANTGYFFVLTSPTTANIEWSYTSSTDYAAAFGASLPATNDSFARNTATGQTNYYSLAAGPQEFQVNGIAGAAVPEPSAWALLATGVGLLSVGALRRRRATKGS